LLNVPQTCVCTVATYYKPVARVKSILMSILGLLADQDDTQGINLNTKVHVKMPKMKPE